MIVIDLESETDPKQFKSELIYKNQNQLLQLSPNKKQNVKNNNNAQLGEVLFPKSCDEDESNQRLIGDGQINMLSKRIILGVAYFRRFWQNRVYFFSLDIKRGRILCFKKIDSKSHTTSVYLKKGYFLNSEESQKDPYILLIKTKKRTVKLDINKEKEIAVIRQHIQNCFNDKAKQLIDKKNLEFKGFFITLGNGQVEIQGNLYQVASGLLICEELNKNIDGISKTPYKTFEEDAYNQNKDYKKKLTKKKTKNNDNCVPVSGMFFGANRLVSEILGVLAIIQNSLLTGKQRTQAQFNSQQQQQPYVNILNSNQNNDLIQDSQICEITETLLGLIFKPQLATIDLIILKLQGDEIVGKEIKQDFFKIRIIPNKKSLLKKSLQRGLAKRIEKEKQLGIDINNMFIVKQTEQEILYMQKQNGYVTEQDIGSIKNMSQQLMLDDIDTTKKREDDYENDRELINGMLDFYEKQKSKVNEEKSCEFLIIYPKKQDLQQLSDEDEDEQTQEYYDSMNEYGGEDTIINYEKLNEIQFNKFVPRPFVVESACQKNLYKGVYSSPYRPSILNRDYNLKEGDHFHTIFNSESSNSKISIQVNTVFNINDNIQFIENRNSEGFIINNDKEKTLIQSEIIDNNNNQEEKKFMEQEIQNKQSQSTSYIDFEDSKFEQKQMGYQFSQQQQNINIQVNGVEQEIQLKSKSMQPIEESSSEEIEDFIDEDEDNVLITNSENDQNEYSKLNKKQLQEWIANFKPFEVTDEVRVAQSHKSGGKHNDIQEQIDLIRGVGKEILSQIGRKILSGDFNLTQVSFPIKAMIPKSALQTILYSTVLFPYYLNKACQITNKVERFKLIITAILGNFPVANTFLKPLNPILGETFEAQYTDGTKLYSEQTSHHPPVSYFLVYGPEKSYVYSGYYLYETNAGWNSLTLKNLGKRNIKFKDGQEIKFNFVHELYSGTFMGTMKCESLGRIEFQDDENQISAFVIIGKVKGKPSDYVSGQIKLKEKVVSNIYGSYLGFLEFDKVRLWDQRFVNPYKMSIIQSFLESDHSKRQDKILLSQRLLKQAQIAKEVLEVQQRNDAKLRKQHQEKIKKELKKKKKN